MQYNRLFLVLSFVSVSLVGMAQVPAERELKMEGGQFTKPRQFFKAQPAEDKTESFDVVGYGSISILVANTADGSPSSYNHNARLTMPITIAGGKTNFQIVFYNTSDLVPYSVEREAAINSVFIPLSMYDVVRTKLEQAVAAKKKVQLKVTSKKDGYREAVLQF
jgi:hypothetical protein